MTYTMNTCTWSKKSKKRKNVEPLETQDTNKFDVK